MAHRARGPQRVHLIATVWPLPPTMEQCACIVDARARFHAAWWDNHSLGSSVGAWSDAEATDRYLQDLAEQFARFSDRLGDSLPRERHDLYERLLDAAPHLLARYHTHRNLTIIQGDSHAWNCFLPRGGGDDVRFFDWDSWRIGAGSGDLAYMMAVHWYPDRRGRTRATAAGPLPRRARVPGRSRLRPPCAVGR